MAKKAVATGKLTEILKGKVEIDFCCPKCEGTKLYEMPAKGRRVRVYSDGEYSVDASDSIEPNRLYYCCGTCGHVIGTYADFAGERPVREPYELLLWLLEDSLDSVRQAACENDHFPTVL